MKILNPLGFTELNFQNSLYKHRERFPLYTALLEKIYFKNKLRSNFCLWMTIPYYRILLLNEFEGLDKLEFLLQNIKSHCFEGIRNWHKTLMNDCSAPSITVVCNKMKSHFCSLYVPDRLGWDLNKVIFKDTENIKSCDLLLLDGHQTHQCEVKYKNSSQTINIIISRISYFLQRLVKDRNLLSANISLSSYIKISSEILIGDINYEIELKIFEFILDISKSQNTNKYIDLTQGCKLYYNPTFGNVQQIPNDEQIGNKARSLACSKTFQCILENANKQMPKYKDLSLRYLYMFLQHDMTHLYALTKFDEILANELKKECLKRDMIGVIEDCGSHG